MHADRRIQAKTSQGSDKTVVIGALERKGRVRTKVASDRKRKTIQPFIQENVQQGATLHSDEFADVWKMPADYTHQVVNHLETYVNGNIHTNGIENFWSLLKRGIGGTYVAVEPFHLFRYVDEQAFRYNNRKDVEGEVLCDYTRFKTALSQVVGRRLTYKELTGKEGENAEAF
jgi:transposase-like protein